ncbi:MAG: peptide deformylase [Pseudoflavonifractor sp.]
MAMRKILTQGDPTLNKVAHSVTVFDDRLADLLEDLRETLTEACGLGLAAPQIGILRRVVVIFREDEEEPLELVNPSILSTEGEQDGLEGCLSVPGYWGMVKRPKKAKLRAQDRHGKWFEIEGEDMLARCFCHELDHLDGHLYTELAPKLYTPDQLDHVSEGGE